jgi:putative component of toxin-antitoxin plasmid stabilization module
MSDGRGRRESRPVGGGLFELRFTCEGTARRVTYFIHTQTKVIALTTFRKQRQNERREVARARQAMRAGQETGGSDG